MNKDHLQGAFGTDLDHLTEKQQAYLLTSWAQVFYEQVFCRIPETLFGCLYDDGFSRPNTPVNVLVGLEFIKSGMGLTDAELMEAFNFNVLVRYALGIRNLGDGEFTLRTLYNFRRRVVEHMEETDEDLMAMAVEIITDGQVEALDLGTKNLRMDSTLIGSNIKNLTRMELLTGVLQQVWRMLEPEDREAYRTEFAPYLGESAFAYPSSLKDGELHERLEDTGRLMFYLVQDFEEKFGDQDAFQLLKRVLSERFGTYSKSLVRVRRPEEISASSVQSPHDPDATYRTKRNESHKGYVLNAVETCDEDNPCNLVIQYQLEPNTADDAAMLKESIPNLVERTEAESLHTDGGYNSSEVDDALRGTGLKQYQTAIRGRKKNSGTMGIECFLWHVDSEDRPVAVTCAWGRRTPVKPTGRGDRYRAEFHAGPCERCPFRAECPAKRYKHRRVRRVLISQRDVDAARRVRRSAEFLKRGKNPRAAMEGTMFAMQYPLRDGKVPVRRLNRSRMYVAGLVIMTNVRRITRAFAALRDNTTDTARQCSNMQHHEQVLRHLAQRLRAALDSVIGLQLDLPPPLSFCGSVR